MNWATIVPVLIGGFLAIVGGYLGKVQEFKNSRKRILREKLEEMTSETFLIADWIQSEIDSLIFQQAEWQSGKSSPINRIQVFIKLYFPDLEKEMLELYIADREYRILINDYGQKVALSDEDSDKSPIYKQFVQESSKFHDTLIQSRNILLDQASKKMKNLL